MKNISRHDLIWSVWYLTEVLASLGITRRDSTAFDARAFVARQLDASTDSDPR
jgi:hypothetical protein